MFLKKCVFVSKCKFNHNFPKTMPMHHKKSTKGITFIYLIATF